MCVWQRFDQHADDWISCNWSLCVLLQMARATDFYQRQAQYRQQRRSRMLARQQRLAQLEQKAQQQQEQQQQQDQQAAQGQQQPASPTPAAEHQAAQPAAWMASTDAHSGGPGITTEPSGSSIVSIEGQPLKVVVHSGSSGSNDGTDAAAAAAAGSSVLVGASSRGGSGSLSSITTDEDTCGICFDNNNHVAIKYCGHRLCVDCYRKVWELSGGDSTCPFCRAKLEGYMYLDSPLGLLE
jgi:hypothetical protein